MRMRRNFVLWTFYTDGILDLVYNQRWNAEKDTENNLENFKQMEIQT